MRVESINNEAPVDYVQSECSPSFKLGSSYVYGDGTNNDVYTSLVYLLTGIGSAPSPTGFTSGTDGMPFTLCLKEQTGAATYQYYALGSCVLDEVTFSFELGKLITIDASGMFQFADDSSTLTFATFYDATVNAGAAVGTRTHYHCNGGEFAIQTGGSGGYTSLSKVQSAKLTLKRNTTPILGKVTGNDSKVYVVPVDFAHGMFEATVELTIPHEAHTYETLYLNGDHAAAATSQVDMTVAIGAKTFTLTGARFEPGSVHKWDKVGLLTETLKTTPFKTLSIA